jgi:uncharacterized membrane protein YgdD (TMEM256/DUF423 family)
LEVTFSGLEIETMQKLYLLIGAGFAGLSVIIGAFGSHGLKGLLEANQRVDTFNTGVTYQFYHSLALLLIGVLMFKISHKFMLYAAWSYIAGILLFSGSLYILSLTNYTKLGAVAPLGGLFFIAGWSFLMIAIVKSL